MSFYAKYITSSLFSKNIYPALQHFIIYTTHNSIKRCAATQLSIFGMVLKHAGSNIFGQHSCNLHAFWSSEELFWHAGKKAANVAARQPAIDVCKTCKSGYFDGDKKKSFRKSHRINWAWFTWLMVLYSCSNKVDTFCAESVEAEGAWPFIWKADKRKTMMKLLATLHMEAKQWSSRSSNFRQKSFSLLLMLIEWSHQWVIYCHHPDNSGPF